jgi:hypothetical protein
VSRRYGARDRAPRCRYLLQTKGSQTITTVLLPTAEMRRETAELRTVATGTTGEAFEVRDGTVVDLLLFDVMSAPVEGVTTDARVAWVRRRVADGEVIAAMFVDGSRVAVDGGFVLQGRRAAAASRGAERWSVEGEEASVEHAASRISSLASRH